MPLATVWFAFNKVNKLSALLGTTILQGLMVSLTHFISNSTAVYCLTTVPCSQKLTISKQ